MYKAVFSNYGEHIHIPIEAGTREEAQEIALRDHPMLASWSLTLKRLVEGQEAKDDRVELKWVGPRMGRPSQGREKRLQFSATSEMESWLEARRIQSGKKSISEVVFEILHQAMEQK